MTKLEKIEQQEQKTRERIAEMQAMLRQIDGQRTEQENLQIIQQVRALRLSRDELYAFITGGDIPATLAGAVGGADATAEPETIYSRRGKKQHTESETPDNDNLYGETENTNFESEDMSNEEN